MATYAAIITAIDDAIASWAGEPVTHTRDGKSFTYRTLDELINARKYYASLANKSRNGRACTIQNLKAGSGQ